MIRRRIAAIDDSAIVRIIREELLPYAQQMFPNMDITREELVSRLQQEQVWVAAEGRSPAYGFVAALVKKRVLWIDMIAIASKRQGRGVGRALLKRAEEFGKAKGCRHVNLYVDQDNVDAQRFYSSNGYAMAEFVPLIRCYRFEKPLASASSFWSRVGIMKKPLLPERR